MVDLAMCSLSHDFFKFQDFIITCTKIGIKLYSQHSTFELVLLVTADECWSKGHLLRFVFFLMYQKETFKCDHYWTF